MPARRANTILMRPRGLTLLLLGTLLCSATPAATAAPDADGGPYRVQMLYRTGKSLAPFDIYMSLTTDTNYGMGFSIELYKPKDRWIKRVGVSYGGYVPIVQGPGTTTYGHPAAALTPRCIPTCTAPFSFSGGGSWQARPLATSRYYFVTARATATIHFDTKGWRLKDVPNPGFRRAFGENSNATGVSGPLGQYEHFTSASAKGGRYGSAAFLAVPCDFDGYGSARIIAKGANTTNYGYDPPDDLECFHDSSYWADYAYTLYETTWRLEGDIIGIGTFDTRIVVFDFPKPSA